MVKASEMSELEEGGRKGSRGLYLNVSYKRDRVV